MNNNRSSFVFEANRLPRTRTIPKDYNPFINLVEGKPFIPHNALFFIESRLEDLLRALCEHDVEVNVVIDDHIPHGYIVVTVYYDEDISDVFTDKEDLRIVKEVLSIAD